MKASGGRAGPRRGLRPVLVGAAALLVIAGGWSAVAAAVARSGLLSAGADLRVGRDALVHHDPAGARTAFRRAGATLARADRVLGSWPVWPDRLLPVVRQNIEVEKALVRGGRQVAAAGLDGASIVAAVPLEAGRLAPRWQGGVVDLGPVVRAGEVAPRMTRHLAAARHLVASSPGLLLLPWVGRARSDALATIEEARRKAEVVESVSFLVPRILGNDGPRRWIVGAENSGELRGRGGYIGSLGVLETDAGRLRLGRFTATTDLPPLSSAAGSTLPAEYRRHYARLGALDSWPNLMMSPDFASAASLLLDRLRASGGPTGGGVIANDPQALSYLLAVTGPVVVAGVPEPISAENVVEWSLNRAYAEFHDDRARKQVLSDIAAAVWGRVATGDGIDGARLAEAVGRALTERHAVLYSEDRREEEAIDRIGVGGRLRSGAGDYVLVLGQNMGENKMDYYVQRHVTYRAEVRRDGSVDSRISVVVRNLADPKVVLPDYVGGPRPAIALGAGTVRTYLSVFVPEEAVIRDFRQDGKLTVGFDNRLELGKREFGTYLEVRAGQAREVSIRYRLPGAGAAADYRLTLQNQATVHPDAWSVEVETPGGTKRRFLRWAGPLVADRTIGGAGAV